jgi:hypothetical protein
MPLADEIKDAIDKAVAEALSKVEFRAGTIVLSPSYQLGDPLTVVLDGSSRAIEVKMIRAFNVFPNARVACARVGVDWTAFGVFLDTTQANIVAGIPGGGRIEFDPYTVKGRVYDEENNLVIELDKSEGVSVYDPQGDTGNRTRLVNEFGSMVLSQLPATDYGFARLVTYIVNEGAADEYVRTAVESSFVPGQTYLEHTSELETTSQRADDSLGSRLTLRARQEDDDAPQSRIQLFAGLIDLQPWASDAAREVRVTNAPFKVNGDHVSGSANGMNANAMTSGTDTTTSGTYANMAGTGSTTSFSFTKRWAATRVKVIMNVSAYATGAAADGMIGVSINGTDYDMMEEAFLLNNRLPYSSVRYISGVAAGTHTVQARWRRTSAAGTLTRDPACWISMSAEEVN